MRHDDVTIYVEVEQNQSFVDFYLVYFLKILSIETFIKFSLTFFISFYLCRIYVLPKTDQTVDGW